jgi:inner membrane protein
MYVIVLILLTVIGILAVLGLVVAARFLYQKYYPGAEDMSQNPASPPPSNVQHSIRFVIVAVIALLMLIPLNTLTDVVSDRYRSYRDVLVDISKQWGNPQDITGPLLVIPIIEQHQHTEKVKDQAGNENVITTDKLYKKHVVVLPQNLKQSITLNEHHRSRGIYKSLVYTADVTIDGTMVLPDISRLSDELETIKYDEAFMVMGLTDTKAINRASPLTFADSAQRFEPGVKIGQIANIRSGFHAMTPLSSDQNNYPFKFSFNTNGSSKLRFSSFGETTDTSIHSTWPHPSFQGAVLPANRIITAEGFDANWSIPSLARNYPQAWILEQQRYDLKSFVTGVDLYEPVSLYSRITRAIKYGILFIALTFLACVAFELGSGRKLHYVQYAVVGLALALFFLTLLASSEHLSFLAAYIGSALVIVTMISLYTGFSARSLGQGIGIMILLTALYSVLYSLLQLEDYALLMGTALLLIMLGVIMWLTRNVQQHA